MTQIITMDNIVLNLPKESHEDAIRRCGGMLARSGYVLPRYTEGMLARDRAFTTAIGNCIAIPHGEKDYKSDILHTGMVVLTYPDPIDWEGQPVRLVIGIAARGEEHLEILGNIVDQLESPKDVLALVNAGDKNAIYAMLTRDSL